MAHFAGPTAELTYLYHAPRPDHRAQSPKYSVKYTNPLGSIWVFLSTQYKHTNHENFFPYLSSQIDSKEKQKQHLK